MLKLNSLSEKKDEWLKVYKKKLDHQQRISSWLLNHNLYPLPVGEDGIDLVRWRCGFIKDRSLRAVLYKMIKDDNRPSKDLRKSIDELVDAHFPLEVAKRLSDDNCNLVKAAYKEAFSSRLKEILNPTLYKPIEMISKFEHIEGYECFGCKPTRSEGLLLEPKVKSGIVSDELKFNDCFVGMNGLVHGGFISMALDEIMGYAITLGMEKLSLTKNLEIEFLRPVRCNQKYKIESQIISTDGNEVYTEGEVKEVDTGKICAKGKAKFFLLNKEVCRRIFPGIYNDPKLEHMCLDN